MNVKAVVSFTGRIKGVIYHITEGDEFELPEGADWLNAGFVVPVRGEKIEKAVVKPQEKAVLATEGQSAEKPAELEEPEDLGEPEAQEESEDQGEVIPKASKAAAELAEEHGIDLGQLEGTGAGGKVIKPDVEKAIEKKEG